jgi:hypothetical protein
VDINEQGLGYANKTICRKTLENGAGADCHLRRNAATPLGGDDLGLGAISSEGTSQDQRINGPTLSSARLYYIL